MVTSGGVIREYDSTNKVYAPTNIPYHTAQKWSRRLTSGLIDDATHNWLSQLIISPQVYMEDADGYHYPVTIKTAAWNEKKRQFDKMYNLEIEVETGRKVTSQNR
jgi:hypothetical protein